MSTQCQFSPFPGSLTHFYPSQRSEAKEAWLPDWKYNCFAGVGAGGGKEPGREGRGALGGAEREVTKQRMSEEHPRWSKDNNLSRLFYPPIPLLQLGLFQLRYLYTPGLLFSPLGVQLRAALAWWERGARPSSGAKSSERSSGCSLLVTPNYPICPHFLWTSKALHPHPAFKLSNQ